MDDHVSYRRMRERDKARDDGDRLARTVKSFLSKPSPKNHLLLWVALNTYRREQTPV